MATVAKVGSAFISCQGCGEPTDNRLCCPQCPKYGRTTFFCSQQCFHKNWSSHNKLHEVIRQSQLEAVKEAATLFSEAFVDPLSSGSSRQLSEEDLKEPSSLVSPTTSDFSVLSFHRSEATTNAPGSVDALSVSRKQPTKPGGSISSTSSVEVGVPFPSLFEGSNNISTRVNSSTNVDTSFIWRSVSERAAFSIPISIGPVDGGHPSYLPLSFNDQPTDNITGYPGYSRRPHGDPTQKSDVLRNTRKIISPSRRRNNLSVEGFSDTKFDREFPFEIPVGDLPSSPSKSAATSMPNKAVNFLGGVATLVWSMTCYMLSSIRTGEFRLGKVCHRVRRKQLIVLLLAIAIFTCALVGVFTSQKKFGLPTNGISVTANNTTNKSISSGDNVSVPESDAIMFESATLNDISSMKQRKPLSVRKSREETIEENNSIGRQPGVIGQSVKSIGDMIQTQRDANIMPVQEGSSTTKVVSEKIVLSDEVKDNPHEYNTPADSTSKQGDELTYTNKTTVERLQAAVEEMKKRLSLLGALPSIPETAKSEAINTADTAVTTPIGAVVNSTPIGAVVNSTPIGAVVNSTPIGAVVNSTPIGAVVNSTPIGAVVNSTTEQAGIRKRDNTKYADDDLVTTSSNSMESVIKPIDQKASKEEENHSFGVIGISGHKRGDQGNLAMK